MSEKSYALLHKKNSSLQELSDDDIKKLHEVLLEIYDDIFDYCNKYSLKLIAGGGTALGAVRHEGFVPWDDDMDFNLTREDYEKFKIHFDKELGEEYDLLAPGYKKGASCFLMRVMKKNTTLLNMIDEVSPYPTGIYIDITPIDYAPSRKIAQKLKGTIADALRFISYSVYWRQYKSESLEHFMTGSDYRLYYRFRMTLGFIFSFRTAEKWFQTFDKFIIGKKSDFVTVAAGRKKYCGEIFDINTFFPLKKTSFEKREMYVYHDVSTYLEKMYGDYMKIPKPEERERHLCAMLNFEKSLGGGLRILDNSYGLARIQEDLLIALDFIDDVCKEFDIYYALHGGTLLGAERNHHMIPWDDDIDISMRRADFEKFKAIIGCDSTNSSFYIDESELWTSRFVICDSDISACIDILVWDYISEKRFGQFLKINSLRALQGMMKKNVDYKMYGWRGKILVGFTQCLGKIICEDMQYALYHKIQTGWFLGKKKYIHKSNDSYRGCGEIFDKTYMDEYTNILLEGREYMVPRRYKEELITSYGENYMDPPPISERCPKHSSYRDVIANKKHEKI